ncbi:BQ5605_C032g11071 [Microbotryum silenes-dioicae]|uniref:BQ5605_C032g11071 protein n=2 Tax=Microbotryum silenes-dioicae TaxID=796604 RepID=A0A2X0MK07_9BASI|nr:BQ5605_C032g11071 [Microbotryum silenes-dioicae]
MIGRVQSKPPKRYTPKEEKDGPSLCVVGQETKGAEHVGHLPDEPVLLEKLPNDDGIDLPVSLIERQPIASELWTRINATESGRAECEDIPALEQDTTAIGADDVDNFVSTIAFTWPCTAAASDKAAAQAYKELASQCQDTSAYYPLNFQIETFAVIGSSYVERKEDRAFRCSAGAEAFSEHIGWLGTDQELDIVKRFTKVLVWAGDVYDKKLTFRDLSIWSVNWCSKRLVSAVSGALQTQRAQEDVGMPSNPKTWFNRPKLLSQDDCPC